MGIEWFCSRSDEGTANLYKTNLTLSAAMISFFETSDHVQVGKNEEGNLVLRPVGYEELESGILDSASVYPIACHKSYVRLSSTPLLAMVGEAFGLELGKDPIKRVARIDRSKGYVVIEMRKEEH